MNRCRKCQWYEWYSYIKNNYPGEYPIGSTGFHYCRVEFDFKKKLNKSNCEYFKAKVNGK